MANHKAIPPDRTKYGFGKLEPGESMELQGEYRLIRIAMNTFNKRNNSNLIAMNGKKTVTIYRKPIKN